MRLPGKRSAFAAALCSGLAMVGVSVHGLAGVDAELQRSAAVARELKRDAVRVSAPLDRSRDCRPAAPSDRV